MRWRVPHIHAWATVFQNNYIHIMRANAQPPLALVTRTAAAIAMSASINGSSSSMVNNFKHCRSFDVEIWYGI